MTNWFTYQASIGFSIPITRMFHSSTVWKGLLFTLLMLLGKMATGFWMWLIPKPTECKVKLPRILKTKKLKTSPVAQATTDQRNAGQDKNSTPVNSAATHSAVEFSTNLESQNVDRLPPETGKPAQQTKRNSSCAQVAQSEPNSTADSMRAYTPLLLGMAMTARGEIGFLIASIGATHGIFSVGSDSEPSSNLTLVANEELYLVVIWAIVLCTIIGPIGAGGLVRHIRRLEKEAGDVVRPQTE